VLKPLYRNLSYISGACVLAVIEVLISSIDYEKKHLPFTFPRGATYSYGISIVLAWLVFIMLLVSGCAFMIYSRKRKGNKAPNEEIAMADEPTIIGR
jgi:cbb3-type cytochrome oxidase subunit 3